MSESLTEGGQGAAASTTESTVTTQPVQQPSAESQNQEAISGGQTQETAATTAEQTQNESGSQADDSLAKFAKGQGYTDEDIAQMSDREKKTLLSLKKSADSFHNQPKIEDVSKTLGTPGDDATDIQKLNARIQAFEYQTKTDSFWGSEGKDRSLEPTMVQILNDRKDKFGKDYAYQLSQDLDTLYAMARLESGAGNSDAAKEEGRREERESINKSLSAGAPTAHATTGTPSTPPQVTLDWIRSEYDSHNPEHRKLVDAFYQGRN